MDLNLTEEQKQLTALIRDFCKREIDHKAMWELAEKAADIKSVEELRAIQPVDFIKKMNDLGLRQLAVPKEYGGGGFTVGENLTRVLLGEEMGFAGGHMAARLLTKDWQTCAVIAGPNTTKEQKDWFFPKFMENDTGLCAHCVSEPEGHTDIALPYDEPGYALRVVAEKDESDWVLNGSKMFSSAGGVADFLWVIARTDKTAPVSKAGTLFWVLKDTPGVTFELNKMIMPDIYGNVQTHFDNVRIPGEQMIGELNQGRALLTDMLGTKLLPFSSVVGYCRNIYEQIVDYARNRVQGGKPIIQHSHIANILGELAIQLEITRSFFFKAAWEIDQREKAGQPRNNFWSVSCFYLAKRLSLILAEVGCEIYGGIAGTSEIPLGRWIQHVYVLLAGGGPMGLDKIESSMWYNNHTLGTPWEKAL